MYGWILIAIVHRSYGINNLLIRSKAAVKEIGLNYCEIAALLWKAAGMLSVVHSYTSTSLDWNRSQTNSEKIGYRNQGSALSFSCEVWFGP